MADIKLAFWKKARDNENPYIDRVAADSIIIEFDNEDRELNAKLIKETRERLTSDGYSYRMLGHNGKSDYIELIIPELKDHQPEVISAYKKKFLEKYAGTDNNVDISYTSRDTYRPAIGKTHWKKALAEKQVAGFSITKYGDYTAHNVLGVYGRYAENKLDSDLLKAANQTRNKITKALQKEGTFLHDKDLIHNILKAYNKHEIVKEEQFFFYVRNPFYPKGSSGTSFKVWKDTATWTCYRSGGADTAHRRGAISMLAILEGFRKDPADLHAKPLDKNEIENISVIAGAKGIKLPFSSSRWAQAFKMTKQFAEELYEINPYFTDDQGILNFWNLQNKTYEPIADSTNLFNRLESIFGYSDKTLTPSKAKRVHERLLRQGLSEEYQPEPLNTKQIATKSGIYNISSGSKESELTYKNWAATIVPHAVNEGKWDTIEQLLRSWADTEEKYEQLIDFLAYLPWNNYNIQKVIVLEGAGGNGKDTFLRLARRLIGLHNCVSENLENFKRDSKGENLYNTKGKLLLELAEVQMDRLKNSDTIKKLRGGGLLSGRGLYQGKKTEWTNKAKVLMTTNKLPVSSDGSIGFFDSFIIIQFNKTFRGTNQEQSQIDLIDSIPEAEFEAFLHHCITKVSPRLYKSNQIRHQLSGAEARDKYMVVANSFLAFYTKYLEQSLTKGNHIPWDLMLHKYTKWVEKLKLQRGSSVRLCSLSEIKKTLEHETATRYSRLVRGRVIESELGGSEQINTLGNHVWKEAADDLD